MKPKTIIIEVLIVTSIFVITWLLFTHYVSNTALDIDMHDTYFVIQPTPIILTAGLLLTTLVYLIKEGFKRYKRKFQKYYTAGRQFFISCKTISVYSIHKYAICSGVDGVPTFIRLR